MAAGEASWAEEEITSDICIVGAGPAGITLAGELDRHGVRVCLLEAGGREVDQRIQRQNRGESDGYPIHLLHESRVRAFGGNLKHPHFRNGVWAARPLDSIDFETRDGRPEFGWPFNREHLNSYYTRAAAQCDIRPFQVASNIWSEQTSTAERRLLDSRNDLEPAIFQYTKPAFHDAWHDLEASPNVRLMLKTRAVEIHVDSTGRRVSSIVAVRGSRERIVIRPRALVFAAGGIENARLLLTANAGAGLGNEHDLVGRYFADRLWLHAGHVVLSNQTSIDQLSSFHGEVGARLGGGLRVAEQVQRQRRLLNVAFFLIPRPASVTSEAVRSLITLRKALDRRPLISDIGWHTGKVLSGARNIADLTASRVLSQPKVLALRAQGEQAPNRESRVSLGRSRDDLGVPVARVTWRMADADLRSIEASASVIDGVLRSRSLGHVEWTARLDSTTLVEGMYHHLGTTRMHADPRQGVVNSDCRVHSVDNLFVAGSSVFPTYGASNPTLTVVALALRLADKLREAV